MRLLILLLLLPTYHLFSQKYGTITASSDFVLVNTIPKVKPQILFFKADKDTVFTGNEITLSWEVLNTQQTQIEVYNKENKLIDTYKTLNSKGEIKKAMNESFTYKLIAQELTLIKKIVVITPPPPVKTEPQNPLLTSSEQPIIISFKADKTEITKGESITLSWSVLNKDQVTIFVGDNIEEIIPTTENNKVKLYPNKHELKVSPKKTQYYVLKADKVLQYIKIEVDE